MNATLRTDITHKNYIADNIGHDAPSLNSSAIKTLITNSPKHAWEGNPKLNPYYVNVEKSDYDIGSAAHTLLLEDERGIVEVNADSWRTNAAKAARDGAREEGKVPLLPHQAEEVRAMVASARAQLKQHEIGDPFDKPGISEGTIIWTENGVLCRCRPDRIVEPTSNMIDVYDYKTTSASVSPDSIVRYAEQQQWMIQNEFYSRGILAAYDSVERVRYRFIAQETKPPYALAVIDFSPLALGMAERKVNFAMGLWHNCLATDSWPGYDRRVITIEPPQWAQVAWQEREERGHAGTDPKAIADMLHWQAPNRAAAKLQRAVDEEAGK